MINKDLTPEERIVLLKDVYKVMANYCKENNISKTEAMAAMINLAMNICLDCKVPYSSFCAYMDEFKDKAKPFFDGDINE